MDVERFAFDDERERFGGEDAFVKVRREQTQRVTHTCCLRLSQPLETRLSQTGISIDDGFPIDREQRARRK